MRSSSILFAISLVSLVACGKEEVPTGDDENAGSETTDTGESESTTGEETTTDTTSETEGGFVPTTDVIDVAVCDPIAQDCPEGEKCVAYASSGGTWDANKCVMVKGSGTAGDQCVYDGAELGSDDCDESTVCWNSLDVDGQLIGTCFPFCTGNVDNPICDDPDLTCRVVNDGIIAICLPRCDPLLQDCPDGLGCYWSGTSGTFQCIIVAGGIPTGEPCGFNNDCNPGNFCADPAVLESCNGSACCASFCDLTEDPTSCTAPYECVPFFDEGTAPPEYTDLGLCILPP
ncbi:ribulose phosphate epimerase [Nannocystaceae bacterium ST9]